MYRLRHLNRLLSNKELDRRSIPRRHPAATTNNSSMEHPAISRGGSGSSNQNIIRCRYLRCATEVIERTKSYDCVRVYHCPNLDDARSSDQCYPPSPTVAARAPTELIATPSCESSPSTPILPMQPSDRAQRRKEKKVRKKGLRNQTKNADMQPLSLRITTTKFHPAVEKTATTRSIVHVKPLIVLDLNGILCHRVRTTSSTNPQTVFRPSCGNISNTDIIPRSDLEEFLTLLHGNFCLAVWTSATRKTSKFLIDALFPKNIRDRLIFVWHRSFCNLVKRKDSQSTLNESVDDDTDCVRSEGRSDKDRLCTMETHSTIAALNTLNTKPCPSPNQSSFVDDVTAVKSLSKVWAAFPLWDDTNTILLDDSPEKCPNKYRSNSLHPPPIRGTFTARLVEGECTEQDSYTVVDDDEVNQRRQRDFFQLLAEYWEQPTENNLTEFMEQHANDHDLRWKIRS